MALTPEHIKKLQAESRFWDRFTYESLKTENGFKALFKPTAGGSNTAWQNSQAKISVIIQAGDGKFYKRDIGVFLIAGVESSLKSDTAVLKLESLAKPMQIASAEKVREAGQWYENVPLSFLINKLLESVYKGEDGLLPDVYSIARQDLKVETAGGQLEFWNLGVPPNWDGQTFQPSPNATPVTAMVSPDGTENIFVALGGTLGFPAEIWLYEPALDLWTFVAGTNSSHWPIQELIYNKTDGLLYGIMWKDRGETEASVYQNPNTWLSPPARIFWWNPELTVVGEYLDDPDKSLFVDKFFPGQWDVREMFPMTSLTETPYYEGVEPDIAIPVDPEEPVVAYACPEGTAEGFGTDFPREDVFAHVTTPNTPDLIYVSGVGWISNHRTATAPAESRIVKWSYNAGTDTWTIASSFQASATSIDVKNLKHSPEKAMIYGTHGSNRIAKIDYTLETYTANTATAGTVANIKPIYIPTIDRVVSIVGTSVVFFDPDTLAQTKILSGILVEGVARFIYHNPVTNTLIAINDRRIYEIDLTTDAVIKFAIYYTSDPVNSERAHWTLGEFALHGTDNQKLVCYAEYDWDWGMVTSSTNLEVQPVGSTVILTINAGLELRPGMTLFFDDFDYNKGGAGEVVTYDAGTGVLELYVTSSYGTGSASSWYLLTNWDRYEIVEVDLVNGNFPFTILTTNSVGDASENAAYSINYSPVTGVYYYSNFYSDRHEIYSLKVADGLSTILVDPGVDLYQNKVSTDAPLSIVLHSYSLPIKHYGCISLPAPYSCPEGTAESFGSDVPREDVFAHTTSVQNIDFLYVDGLGWFASHITFTAPSESRLARWSYDELTDTWTIASSFQLSANTTQSKNLSYAAAKSMIYCTYNANRIGKIDYTLETLTVNGTTAGAVANITPIYIPTIDRVVSIVGTSVVFFDPDTLAQTKILSSILNSGVARFVYHNPVTNTLIAATTRRIYEIDLTTDAVIKFAIYYEADPVNSENKFWELDSWAPHGTDNQKLIARARHSWDYNYVSSPTTNEIQAIGQTMVFTVNTLLDLRPGMKLYFDSSTYSQGGAGEVVTYDAGTGYLQLLLYNSYGTGSASLWYFNPDSFRYEIVEVDLVTGNFPITFLTTNSVGDAEENAVQKIAYSPVTGAYYFSNSISNRNELFEFKPEDGLATAIGEPGVANTVTAVRTEGIFSVIMFGYNVNVKHYGCIVPQPASFEVNTTSTTPLTSSEGVMEMLTLSDGTMVMRVQDDSFNNHVKRYLVERAGSVITFTEQLKIDSIDGLGETTHGVATHPHGYIAITSKRNSDNMTLAQMFNSSGGLMYTFQYKSSDLFANQFDSLQLNRVGQALVTADGNSPIGSPNHPQLISTTGTSLREYVQSTNNISYGLIDKYHNTYFINTSTINNSRIIKYNASGTQMWVYTNIRISQQAMTMDEDHEHLITYALDLDIGDPNGEWVMMKFNVATGAEVYKTWDNSGLGINTGPIKENILVFNGFIYLAQQGSLRKYNATTGALIGSTPYIGTNAGSIRKDTNGLIYVSITATSGNNFFIFDDLTLLASGRTPAGITILRSFDVFPGAAHLFQVPGVIPLDTLLLDAETTTPISGSSSTVSFTP